MLHVVVLGLLLLVEILVVVGVGVLLVFILVVVGDLPVRSLRALFMYLAIAGRLPTFLAIIFQTCLFCASLCTSVYVRYDGRSMNKPPSEPRSN